MGWGDGWEPIKGTQQILVAPAAPSTTGKATQFSLAAAGSLTGIAQPDFARNLVYSFSAAVTSCTIVATGLNAAGYPATEVMTGNDDQTGNVAFSQVTSIAVTAVVGGSGKTLDIGHGKKMGLTNPIALSSDIYKVTIDGVDSPVASQTISAAYGTITFAADPDGTKRFEVYQKGD